ncbi:Oidioi.mRNA.OKI2018_I69.chr2.g7632.t1.cds [Oikopleura dioica]|uniref:Dynein light chain n=1 Tax=Oikopleura dioica TaxID=34765 RepID=A0ABN7T7F0_OIKDI|nr:Oidioi.mRNA.OKI2018_I69.chr2.g7632.t1.cds [Oikopleura dioica]
MAEAQKQEREELAHRAGHGFPLVIDCDMQEEMSSEASDAAVTAVEKYSNNYSLAAKMVKEQMDKKFGAAWHCIIGEGFDANVDADCGAKMVMMFGGAVGVLLWKCN